MKIQQIMIHLEIHKTSLASKLNGIHVVNEMQTNRYNHIAMHFIFGANVLDVLGALRCLFHISHG